MPQRTPFWDAFERKAGSSASSPRLTSHFWTGMKELMSCCYDYLSSSHFSLFSPHLSTHASWSKHSCFRFQYFFTHTQSHALAHKLPPTSYSHFIHSWTSPHTLLPTSHSHFIHSFTSPHTLLPTSHSHFIHSFTCPHTYTPYLCRHSLSLLPDLTKPQGETSSILLSVVLLPVVL